MTIEERIAWAKKQRNIAFNKNSVQGISYWDGYISALRELTKETDYIILKPKRKGGAYEVL